MAKSIQPVWVGKLRKQLKRAGEKDSDFSRFGADGHKYQLEPPALKETIAAFEARFGVSLPEGYRNFLLWMGNGGAGPFYGLYSLGALEPCQLPDYPSGAVLPLGTPGWNGSGCRCLTNSAPPKMQKTITRAVKCI